MAALVFLWFAFLLRGFWYCALLPPWEGYDEPYHFAALQHVAGGQGPPHANTPISLEVQKSLHLLPLPWELQFQNISGPLMPHDDFWRLPPAERERRINAIRTLAPEEGSQPSTEGTLNYESQQPPLYYWLFGIPLRWMGSLSLLSQLYLLRLLGVLLASISIPLAFWIAKQVLHSETQALGVVAVIILLPELMIHLAHIGNESPALVCYTMMLVAALEVARQPSKWRGWLLMGTALGLGLLAKAYFLTAVPAMIGVAAIAFWSHCGSTASPSSIRPILLRLGATLAVTLVIAGRWYANVRSTTGSWSGLGLVAAQRHASMLQKLAAVLHVNWKSGVLSILISHVWFGGWSFLRVPVTVYVAAFAAIALAVAGTAIRIFRSPNSLSDQRDVVVLVAFYVCFWAGLAYYVLVTYLSLGASSSPGWYLYSAVAAEIVLLAWGLQAFAPARIVFPSLAAGVAVLDLYGTHALLMPYYTGLTSHVGKSVPAALWTTLSQLPMVFDRLAQLRPPWLNPALLCLWVGYWIATVAPVLAVFIIFRKSAIDA